MRLNLYGLIWVKIIISICSGIVHRVVGSNREISNKSEGHSISTHRHTSTLIDKHTRTTPTVQESDLSKWRCTTGPWVTGGRHSQSQAVFEVWRVNTRLALSCHLLCLLSQDVTWNRGGGEYSLSVRMHVCMSVCSCTFSIVSLPHGWVYASEHTHGATHVCWNPLHPRTIRPNTHGEIHAVATKETMHGAIDIFLLTQCSLQKWLKAINHGERLWNTSSLPPALALTHTGQAPPAPPLPQSSLEALSNLLLFFKDHLLSIIFTYCFSHKS